MSKAGMMLLSLIISIFVWLVAQSDRETNIKEFANIPLELRGLPDGLTVLGDKNVAATLTAKGPSDLVKKIQSDDLKPFIDLSRAGPITKSFPVQLERLARYKDQGIDFTLGSKRLTIDRTAERVIKVSTLATGSLKAPNLTYQSSTIEPERVTVSGPESLVKEVRTARVFLDLSAVGTGMAQTRAVELLDKDSTLVTDVNCDPKEVTIRPVVAAADQSRMLTVVPTFGEGQPEFGYKVTKYSVTPSQVLVGGSSEALARLRTQTVGTTAINLTGLTQSTTVTVDLDTSNLRGAHPLHTKSVKVRVQIEPIIGTPH